MIARKTVFILALCSGLLSLLNGQQMQFDFEKFPNDMMLSQCPITAILQDHRGFIWIGTWSGLIQFDGYNIRHYRQQADNTNGLESNKIIALFEDSQQRLWVGSQNSGFYLYDRSRDFFVRYGKDADDMNSLSNNNVWAIYEDIYGLLWIGTEGGLNFFNPETGRFIHLKRNPDDARSISFDFVYSICESSDGSLWIATEQGLNRLVRHANHEPDYLIRYSLAPAGTLEGTDEFGAHNYIYKIRPVKNLPNTLWAGTKEGLKKLTLSPHDINTLSVEEYKYNPKDPSSLSHNFVVDMWEDDVDGLWVATFGGLNVRKLGENTFTRLYTDDTSPGHFSSNIVKALYHDRSNVLWIGTEGGMRKLDLEAKPFQTLRPGGQSVTAIVKSYVADGIWTGTRGGGVYFVSTDSRQPRTIHPDYQVSAGADVSGFVSDLVLDKYGSLWMTTLGAGLIMMREDEALRMKNPPVKQFSINGNLDLLGEEHLMSLIESHNGLWISTWDDGVVRYDMHTGSFKRFLTTRDFEVNLSSFPVVHLEITEEDGRHILWAGTRGNGLLKLFFNPTSQTLELLRHDMLQLDNPESLSSNFINVLFTDHSNRLWVGTENGLNLYHESSAQFIQPGAQYGLDKMIIQAIEEDISGRLWVSTQQGILVLSGDPLNDKFMLQSFDAYDGLQDNYFNDHSSCELEDGVLAFGGARGLSVFNPLEIFPDTVPPQVAITDFRLFNKSVAIGETHDGRVILSQSIADTEHIRLTHRDHVISFEFVGLQFREPKKTTYAYKLEGFDPDWVYTDASHRIAHYTNLPYADFEFKVKAANGDGIWSEPETIFLSVSPPFWLTGGAYVLYALFIGALIFIVYRVAKMRANLQHSLHLAHLERENIEEVNKMKMNFFTNLSHELRTPLTLILSPLEQLLTEPESKMPRHTTYMTMRNNANRLLTMINQLLDFRKSEAGLVQMRVAPVDVVEFMLEIVASFKGLARQRQLSLHGKSDIDHLQVWCDHDWMEKVIYNLLSNALKFTPEGGKVSVEVMSSLLDNADSVEIVVRDTGPGIPEDELAKIFERFYQVTCRSDLTHVTGTGIGLALSKFVIDAHHGKIWAENAPEGGAKFCVRLRLGESHFSEEQKIAVHEMQTGKSIDEMLNETVAFETEVVAGSAIIQDMSKSVELPCVLIVDDNHDIRTFLRENLEDRYEILESADGKAGLAIALASPPDLVIADISMPEMDGIDMCAALKSNILTSHIPVLILTARNSMTFRLGSLETGADDYITKPFNMQLVAARVRNLIDSRRVLKEKFARSIDLSPSNLVIGSLDEEFISRVKSVIEKHIDDSEFTVDHLAKAVHMSRMQLYRKLKALTGKSPNKIIRGMRLKRAAQLLDTLQYNVSDVTYMVGYSDLKSFREQFKKEFGVSPSEYEQRN